jgi:hypothetical protein
MYDPLHYLGNIVRRVNRTEWPNWTQLNSHLDQYWDIADLGLGGTDPFITYSHDLNGLYYRIEGRRFHAGNRTMFFFQPPYEVAVEQIPPQPLPTLITKGQP